MKGCTSVPKSCSEFGFPYMSHANGSMASRTRGSTMVVALLSRYTRSIAS